jgi:hypothetical protein
MGMRSGCSLGIDRAGLLPPGIASSQALDRSDCIRHPGLRPHPAPNLTGSLSHPVTLRLDERAPKSRGIRPGSAAENEFKM